MSDLALAHALVDLAGVIALEHLSRGVTARAKPDGSVVTEADLDVEEAIREILRRERPGDAFLGEEGGASGSGARRWIVDGIDRTAAFVEGESGWGTLVALEDAGEIVLGVAGSPSLQRRWWATRGGGAFTSETDGGPAGQQQRLRVSAVTSLPEAVFQVMPPLSSLRGRRRRSAEALANRCGKRPRLGLSALGVASGEVDVSLHLGCGPWDLAAPAIIVSEAGGRFTDLDGGTSLDQHGAIFTNGLLHAAALDAMHRA